MAGRIAGITIEIGGDTTKLQSALKGVDKTLKTTQNNLKDIDKLLKFNPANVELLTQKQKNLKTAIEETKNRLKELKEAQNGVEKGTAEWDALQREIIATEQDLSQLESQYRSFGSVAKQVVQEAAEKMKDFGEKMERVGKDMTQKVTVPIVAGFTAAVKTTADFDTAMSEVAATMGKSVDEIKDLRDYARDMGATTAFSASEAAEAMNYMALAGYDDAKIMKMLPSVLNLAAAGNIDLASASDMVTDAQSALGLTMEETETLVNQMAKTSSKSNTSVEQLGEGILKIGATARSVKGGTKELSTILGVLADNGIKGAEGGTHLRNMLLSLQNPSEAGANALEKLKINVYDADGNMRSMIDIMQEMRQKMQGMSQEAKDTMLSGIFNKTDLAAVNAVLGTTSERWDKLGNAIGNSGNAAEEMANTKLDNLNGQLTLLKSALQELAISFGDTLMPTIRKIVSGIQGLIDKFNNLDPKTKELIAKVLLIVAAIGPLLVIGGKIVQMISLIAMGFSVLLSPIGLVIAAIAALIAIGVLLYTHWDELKAKAKEFVEGVKAGFEQLKTDVSNAVERLKTSAINTFENLKSRVGNIWESIKTKITRPFEEAWNTVNEIVEKIKNMFNFTISFPHISLPHFSWSWNDLGLIKIPNISVEWYKKAYDQPYLFSSPTVIGNRGFGDGNGSEMVYGKDSLMKDIRQAMSSVASDTPIVITVQSILDGKVIGQSVTRYQNGVARAMGV